MRKIAIDIVSDVVCPWCLIGLRRLELALADLPEVEATVTFRPFELDPSTPREGVDLRERLQKKYGGDPEAMFARVEAAAAESGLALDFGKVRRSVNTLAAHTLLRAAIGKGTQRALARALFDAYFVAGRDVGDPEVLAELAADHGFARDEALALVADERERARTRAECVEAQESGVRAVPFFVFDQRLAVSGAQSPEVLRAAIERALSGVDFPDG